MRHLCNVMQANWSCSADCHLGYFVYMSFNETDFSNFGKVYNYNNRSAGYYKNNLTANAHPESKTWLTSMVRLYRSKGIAEDDVYYMCVCVVAKNAYNCKLFFIPTCR